MWYCVDWWNTALGPASFLTSFPSDCHVALRWLVRRTMTGVWFQHSRDNDFPHWSAADVSRRQWTATIYFRRFSSRSASHRLLWLLTIRGGCLSGFSRGILIATFSVIGWRSSGWFAARNPTQSYNVGSSSRTHTQPKSCCFIYLFLFFYSFFFPTGFQTVHRMKHTTDSSAGCKMKSKIEEQCSPAVALSQDGEHD